MTPTTNRVIQMLSTALELEDEGFHFYDRTSAGCVNDVGIKIFQSLRDDEMVHAQRIKLIYQSLTGGMGWTTDWKNLPPAHTGMQVWFRDLFDKQPAIRPEVCEISAVEIGLELEVKSVKFYEQHLAPAVDPSEREFLITLSREEQGHYALLADLKLYLTDPSSWFLERQRGILDGV